MPWLCVGRAKKGEVRVLSYADLYREVNRAANALRALGLGKGDAIGLYMPMTPEIAIALLAIAKIGGVILPLFSGYGAGAIATRLVDADAKALFCADGAYRRGRMVDMKAVADEALAAVAIGASMSSSTAAAGIDIPWTAGRDHWWQRVDPGAAPTKRRPSAPSAEDVIMIIYTSGTTGQPKGAVHTHCGFPIKAAQDMAMVHGRAAGRDDVLDDRHGLDDGAVGGVRHAAGGRDHAFLRRRPRFPGRGSAVASWWTIMASPISASRPP